MAKKTNFEVNGKQYFRVTRTIGKKSDGTSIRKTFYGSGINEANQKADEYMNNIKNGLVHNFKDITLNDLIYSWLFDFLHQSSKIKPSTFQRYESVYRNYIKNSNIAGLKVCNLTNLKLQKYYNELSENNFTYSQIKTLNKILKTFYNWCIDNDYVLKNPCLKVNIKGNKNDILSKQNKEVEIFSEDEINIIKDKLKGNKYELLVLLDFATGLRQGELLALDWKNIDLQNKTIKVTQTVKEVYIYTDNENKHIETIFQSPKTANSIREIPIPDNIVNMLASIKHKEGLLFYDNLNNPLKAKRIFDFWKKLLSNCDIPYKKFHSIRHTYASMLLKNGVDIETVAELMGHTAISITQIYLHSSNNQKQNAVNKLNYLF